jgi:hypothetical protein
VRRFARFVINFHFKFVSATDAADVDLGHSPCPFYLVSILLYERTTVSNRFNTAIKSSETPVSGRTVSKRPFQKQAAAPSLKVPPHIISEGAQSRHLREARRRLPKCRPYRR